MFIGRERELASLKEFYEKDRIGMIVIYGRRRIGKSTLITEFVKDKKTIFYTATKVGKHRNLELFSRQVLDVLMPGVENISFNTTEAVFDFIDKNIGDEKLVLVIICYGITGGVAKYLSMIDPAKSMDENIIRLFFRTDGYLYDETRNLLTQEFADVSVVNNIVEQIASGGNTLNTIAGKIGEKEQTVLYSLDKLISVGLIEKKKCITDEKNKKKTQYVLKDYMFKFWYEFIPKAISVIEMGQGEIYYKKAVKPILHSFMGSVFEEMCRYYTLMKGIMGEYGCFITSVGTWWGVENVRDKNGEIRSQSADIDVVALSETDKKAVVGECKFKNEKIDKGIYETLIRRGKLINAKYEVTKYIFFSLSGYTDWFAELADEDVLLLTLDSLYE